MIVDRDEDMSRCFYHFFFIVNVHSKLSVANIGIFMDSSSYKICSFKSQELAIS